MPPVALPIDVGTPPHGRPIAATVAFWSLALFLGAVVGALVVTVETVPPPVKLIAGAVVTPILALTLLALYYEWRGRPWSYGLAAALGLAGVTLRLIVNSRPSLEVAGGLPLGITIAYVALGLVVGGTSLYAGVRTRRDGSMNG